MLLNRLQAVCKLKWRVVRNYARRKPVEASLRIIVFAMIPLSWIPMVSQLGRPGGGHEGYQLVGMLVWMIFISFCAFR
jgi:hypothetical protein